MGRKKSGDAGETPSLTVVEGGKVPLVPAEKPTKTAKPPKAEKPPKAPKEKPPAKNMEKLSGEQRQTLYLHHTDKIERLNNAVAAAQLAVKQARKIAKSDLGDKGLKDIDTGLKLRKPGGEVTLREQADRIMRVANWEGAQVGQQLTLLSTIPPRDWFQLGKISGMKGEALRQQDGASQKDQQTFSRGYEQGRQTLIDAFGSDQPLAEKARQELADQNRGAAPPPPATPDPEDLRGTAQKAAEYEQTTGEPYEPQAPSIGTEPPSHKTKH